MAEVPLHEGNEEDAPPPEEDIVREPEPGDSSLMDQVTRAEEEAPEEDEAEEEPDNTGKLIFKERPDWLAENFYDAKTGEVLIEQLQKSQKDLRTRLARGEDKALENPADYKLELNAEEDADLVELENLMYAETPKDDDVLVQWFRDKAVEHKMSAETVTDLYKGYLRVTKDNLQIVDPALEHKRLGRQGQAILKGITDFHDHLIDRGVFNEAEAARVRSWVQTAEDVTAFQKIRDYYGEAAPPMSTVVPDGAMSKEELREKMGQVKTQLEHDRLMKEYEKLYGTDPA